METMSIGTLAEWFVVAGAVISVYVNLHMKIERVSNSCIRKEELDSIIRQLERHLDDKFRSLRELIDEKLKRNSR